MNILHLKYAVEISKTKSISRAAQNLYMGQPNLSRAIKELEENLGITIFRRTSKGITVTPEGEEFLQYAKPIISQVDAIEELYRNGKTGKQSFSVCAPRTTYISYAFSEFAKHIKTDTPADIFYKETNSMRTINNVVREDYNLGIIRYQSAFEKYFSTMFDEKKLDYETITEFSYVLLLSRRHPLAERDNISPRDLSDYIEVIHGDPYVPSLPLIDVKKAELSEYVDKRIYVFDRSSQFEILSSVPDTFMWVSPISEKLLSSFELVQKRVNANKKIYKDVLIRRRDYRLTELDRIFIEKLAEAKERFMK